MEVFIIIGLLTLTLIILLVLLVFLVKSRKKEVKYFEELLEKAQLKIQGLESEYALKSQHLVKAQEEISGYASLEQSFREEQHRLFLEQNQLGESLTIAKSMYEQLLNQSNDAKIRLKQAMDELVALRQVIHEKEVELSSMKNSMK